MARFQACHQLQLSKMKSLFTPFAQFARDGIAEGRAQGSGEM
jgi:hypothetical protein